MTPGRVYAGPVRLALAALALAAACNRSADQDTGFSSSITTAPPPGTNSTGEAPGDTSTSSTSTSSAEDSAAASSASSGSSTSSASGFPDVGLPPDGGDGPPPGCKGKVDIVFSIDSSFTMEPKQARLKASFPGFIATLESEFADFDYHILSANTRQVSWGLATCKDCIDTCPDGPPDYPCGVQLETCDKVNGAGVTFAAGWNASNERCELASDRRYITPGQPELVDAFTCIASVGTNGTGEVAQGAVAAVADDINAPDGCNAGFLRPDALLVVVAIQDTFDQFSEGTAKDWADALIAAKGGDADAVVLLVVSSDVDDPDSLCGYTGTITEHALRTWTKIMPHALFGSICADGYADYFATVATMITEQCDVFAPQ